MDVYLFRHGEAGNPNMVLYGRLPGFHLSEAGRKHVKKTAQKLLGQDIKKIYSSPLERAVETAEILIDVLGLTKEDLIIDERLIESDQRKWQGTALELFVKKVVFGMPPRSQREVELITHAGARVLSVLNGSIKKDRKNVVIVSHGDPLTGALIEMTGDWSFVEDRGAVGRYIKKSEFARVSLKENRWHVEEFSF